MRFYVQQNESSFRAFHIICSSLSAQTPFVKWSWLDRFSHTIQIHVFSQLISILRSLPFGNLNITKDKHNGVAAAVAMCLFFFLWVLNCKCAE